MSIISWLDVERIIRKKTNNFSFFPDGVTRISCFSDEIEIAVKDEKFVSVVSSKLADWFPGRLTSDRIETDIDALSIRVVFCLESEDPLGAAPKYPLWSHLAYVGDEGRGAPLPSKSAGIGSRVAVFHSFKGGVGRTTALMTFVSAALSHAKDKSEPIKLLVIDADTEAPGITYWLSKANRPDVSFLKFLEALKYAGSKEDVCDHFSSELKKSSIDWAGSEVFILPAYESEEDLLDTPVLPENIARNPEEPWALTEGIAELGRKLGVDLIFIDLRAGLTELASPLLFDSRLERFLVSTVAKQSVSGTRIVLRNIAKLVHGLEADAKTRHPIVISSLITDAIRESEAYRNFREEMENSYSAAALHPDDLLTSSLSYMESAFDQNFMNFADIESVIGTLRSSTLFDAARRWVGSVSEDRRLPRAGNQIDENPEVDDAAARLQRICEMFEFAERGGADELLETETLRNFAKHFSKQIPNAISIGAKGAGKTFTFLQLCRLGSWGAFLNKLGQDSFFDRDVFIFPLRSSDAMQDDAVNIIGECRDLFLARVGRKGFSESELKERVERFLHSSEKLPSDWVSFWVDQIAEVVGCPPGSSLREIHEFLGAHGIKVIFIIDGIEDSFKGAAQDLRQTFAVEGILEIPNRVRELRNSNVGFIGFVREDYVRAVKTQNYAQFVDRYQPFQLVWSPHSFLQLAHWVCGVAGVINASTSDSVALSVEELVVSLEGLWGRKLGRDDAKEAYSARWVFAALSDFNGRLQARDLVRFLKNAAVTAKSKRGSWFDRVLPPESIRDALRLSSAEKVQEAVAEYEALRKWNENLDQIPAENKKMPFEPRNVGLNEQALLAELQAIGVVFEDKDKQENDRFYLPEIYRSGLGFESTVKARPRVQALLQKSLGRLPF